MKKSNLQKGKSTTLGEDTPLDRQSADPAYIQICNLLKQQIADGIYLPGSRLPSESKLRRIHHVSPMTVRRSIKILTDQGVVKTIRGSGTFVRSPDLGQVNFSLEEFYNIFKDKERTQVKLLDVRTIPADMDTANKLQVKKNKRVILLKRLLLQSGDPIIYHQEFLVYDPMRPIIETELEVTSLYGLFKGSGKSFLKRGEFSIEAMVLNQKEAKLLNTIPLQPAFRLEHLFYDFNETPFSWGKFICRGDQLKFKTTVGVGRANN